MCYRSIIIDFFNDFYQGDLYYRRCTYHISLNKRLGAFFLIKKKKFGLKEGCLIYRRFFKSFFQRIVILFQLNLFKIEKQKEHYNIIHVNVKSILLV